MLGDGRGRHLEIRELGEQQLDRLRVGPLVDAVERVAAAPGEQLGDGLVRGDHQLLDEHVRERLALDPGALDAALAVEGELDLAGPRPAARRARIGGRGGAARPARRAAAPRVTSSPARSSPARIAWACAVREPLAAADEAAVEARLAGLERRRRTGSRP